MPDISQIEHLAWEATRLLEKGSHAENIDDPTLERIREAHKKLDKLLEITDTTRKDYYVSFGGVVSELTTKEDAMQIVFDFYLTEWEVFGIRACQIVGKFPYDAWIPKGLVSSTIARIHRFEP